ncbi:uncharacterized protein LOC143603842 [Bidens hawaiensis]|uniref:uncharacterized protein LOC143603842 n=1 Tax=Bidens hawaiensis TaxID=980011 RepID=UPI004049975B
MTHATLKEEPKKGLWFLDSACSNHMTGRKDWFMNLDERFAHTVKLGNDLRLNVKGIGDVKLEIGGVSQIVSKVYYVPELTSSLLSIGQLQEKDLTVVIRRGVCKIYHPHRGVIITSTMTKNRMFLVNVNVRVSQHRCFKTASDEEGQMWHRRFGHVNFKSIRTMQYKGLVKGLPKVVEPTTNCEVCNLGKQQRESVPKKSMWRANEKLQLIHTDLCGPIEPESPSGKRYVMVLIDDYSRKGWVYFLGKKSEALDHFKQFKVMVEKESRLFIKALRSDRGDGAQEDFTESFAFALVNGALGVFEVHGRRIRDFRPKWPDASFISSEGLITAMAYRIPHVVMGDKLGNVRWWDVTTGQSSSFSTHREGIRRIKFSPVVLGDRSLGRIAVLFNDNTFSVFDLDSQDPLANSLLQTQYPGTLVLELDWLPVRTDKNDPLILCIAGADSSFCLIQVNINVTHPGCVKERFRPMPICSPVLLPTPHAMALRLILQYRVKPSWFDTHSAIPDIKGNPQMLRSSSSVGDLRSYLIDASPIGGSVVPELLLKALDPYRRECCVLDDERVRQYASILNKGSAARFSFAAAIFGETLEAYFWLQLPHALKHLLNMLSNKSLKRAPVKLPTTSVDDTAILTRMFTKGRSKAVSTHTTSVNDGQLRMMAFDQQELWENASERIAWHEQLEGEQSIQNCVHELVTVGNLNAAVHLLLSTPPESSFFYLNALRAIALSSAVSRSLNELAVKVVAANMVRTDRSLSGTHLLCSVGRYQEACSQLSVMFICLLQDAGCWTDAATLAATHLKGTDYVRVMQRWAGHVLNAEHNIWRYIIMYVAAGSLQDALAALHEAQQPDTAAMFIIACREVHAEFIENLDPNEDPSVKEKLLVLHGLNPQNEVVIAVGELYTKYQQNLVHLCMDSPPISE